MEQNEPLNHNSLYILVVFRLKQNTFEMRLNGGLDMAKIDGAGGTAGGIYTFFFGLGMTIGGGYLFMDHVKVGQGF